MKKEKKKLYIQAKKRLLRHVVGTERKPRLSVFRSNKHIYAQLIDDHNGLTLCSSSTLEITKFVANFFQINKILKAYLVGRVVANKAIKLGIGSIVFDRGEKEYKGRIKNLAEGARKESLFF